MHVSSIIAFCIVAYFSIVVLGIAYDLRRWIGKRQAAVKNHAH